MHLTVLPVTLAGVRPLAHSPPVLCLEACHSSTTMYLFLDTAITAMSALMIVMLVPSGRYLGLISYLLDLTSSQAVVMGWAPLVPSLEPRARCSY